MGRRTDFYATAPRPYPAARLPEGLEERLLPRPHWLEIDPERRIGLGPADASRPLSVSVPPDCRLAAWPWLERALDRWHAAPSRASGGVEARIVLRHGEAAGGVAVPGHPEAYALAASSNGQGDGRVEVAARTDTGLLRGAVTAAQLLERGPGDELRVPPARVADQPATRRRILGGWVLCRGYRLREAVDLAVEAKADRVLYNAWGWTEGDRLEEADRRLVDYARERGVELVFELRRVSIGADRRVSDPAVARRILEDYRSAVEHGFRAFGLLFDDVAWDTPEEECGLIRAVHGELRRLLGGDPELYTCPRYYWFPGQMSLDWNGAAGDEETARQRAYLATWGRLLPPGVEVHIANHWADFPGDWRERLEGEWTALLGRRPVFFDNQLINDYRLGLVLPFALRQRPEDLGERFAGWLLNAPLPLDANHAAIAAALARAWNPAARDAEGALGAALHWRHGSAAPEVAEALERLVALANELAGGRFTATGHWRTAADRLLSGRADGADATRWRRAAAELDSAWCAAIARTPAGAPPGVLRGLAQSLASARRLAVDLEALEAWHAAHAARGTPEEAARCARFRRELARARRHDLEHVASLLPPFPDLEPAGDARHTAAGSDRDEATGPPEGPGRSWAMYFLETTRAEIDTAGGDLLRALDGT